MGTPVRTVPSPAGGGAPVLTGRERLVLERVAGGDTYAAVARSLGISHNTAEWYGKQVMRKLGAKSIAHAVLLACQAGVLDGRPRRHGDHAGFAAHRARSEEPCDECWAGERVYRADLRRARRTAKADAA